MARGLENTRQIVAKVSFATLMLAWIGTAQAEPVTITFLHTNDIYEIAPVDGQGGFAELATLLKQERARAPGIAPARALAVSRSMGQVFSPSSTRAGTRIAAARTAGNWKSPITAES